MAAELAAARPDLITLDLKLGGESGLEVARKVRETCDVPIEMITSKSDTIDRVVGLELGADDYIGKQFHVREVLARVRTVLRRYQGAPALTDAAEAPAAAGECYAFGEWMLDLPRRELKSAAGTVRDLTTAEFKMLEMFGKRPARLLSRDNIMDLFKGLEWSPFDRSIDALVVRVRRKIEAEPEAPRMFKTVREDTPVRLVLAVSSSPSHPPTVTGHAIEGQSMGPAPHHARTAIVRQVKCRHAGCRLPS